MKTKQMMLLLCAWILWENMADANNIYSSAKFTPDSSYQTQQECLEGLKIAWGNRAKFNPKDNFFYRCLPDTVDPRGVKGGTP